MCGIVGYIGPKPAAPVLLEGLAKLEYRGYDSAGIATICGEQIKVIKQKGKLEVLEAALADEELGGSIGIGHTRWATHGKPSDENAHPHYDCSGRFAVVHNGIIENYQDLKDELIKEGHTFRSETDTEVLAHLVEKFYNGDLLETINQVIKQVDGAYAMVILSTDEPDKLVCARKDSPLVVGLGEGENFLASDIPAILKHTRKTFIMEDGEVAVVTDQRVEVFNQKGKVDKEVYQVDWDIEAAEKGGYPHFMLKEIFEQPRALRATLKGRLDNGGVLLDELKQIKNLNDINKVYFVACGTAYHAGLVGKYVMENLARIPAEADIASEFRYRDPLIDENTLVVVISQSGETADTLAAMREAQSKGAPVVAITNVVGSSVSREADAVIYTWAGPEVAVASTKAYLTQLAAAYLLGLFIGQERKVLTSDQVTSVTQALRELPEQLEQVLGHAETVEKLAGEWAKREDAFFIGRGLDYAVSLEGSLKLKEISYIHAEAYAAGELKHGTLALITEGIPVVALATQSSIYDKTVSNIKEVKARGAHVTAVVFEDSNISQSVDQVITIPNTIPLLAPILTVVPLQLLAYYAAVARGSDVDKPRNLAKSVTVE
ncbi:glutamine--fructose-6-phosphate transaminase (isomerizing) [Metallumcola ferriviriculae]|uniref:Glutamine--fructose-6-phosphate aminotransferase [isomerizing] n=1 Tax=Metallumcola ferriviriculae TaxID=3039180 RepID=A0AAU0UJD3_9FIRM|nr:glutamine--fructose-6-phosphate transaminase (isomerizing) [Desulfitibacteraceae bacterium MK1]